MLAELRAKFAPPGSNLYYSLLTVPAAEQPLFLCLRSWLQQFNQLALLDVTPAMAKIGWWQEQLITTQPTYELAWQLSALQKEKLLIMIAAYAEDINCPIYEDATQLASFYQQTAGILETLFLPTNLEQIEAANVGMAHLGIFMQQASHLQNLRILLSHQHPYLPGDWLIQHQVTLAQLVEWQTTPAIQALLQYKATVALDHFNQAQDLLLPQWRRALAPTLKLANIYRAILSEIVAANFSVLQQHIDLTPLRKWWISWRR